MYAEHTARSYVKDNATLRKQLEAAEKDALASKIDCEHMRNEECEECIEKDKRIELQSNHIDHLEGVEIQHKDKLAQAEKGVDLLRAVMGDHPAHTMGYAHIECNDNNRLFPRLWKWLFGKAE